MPVGSTTVTCTSRPSWRASRLAASVPPTPPPSTTTLAGIAAHRAFRTRKRVKPSSAATSTSSCRALATQAGMSVAEPASLDQTSTTAPTSRWRIAPISDSSGPGQAIPRASITWSVVTWLIVISSVSDEAELAAALGLQPPHRGGAVGSCLGRQAVVLGEVAGPKRVQRPVLQQDVDLPPQRRRTRCEQRGGVELLVGSRQQRDRQGLLAVAHVPASSL